MRKYYLLVGVVVVLGAVGCRFATPQPVTVNLHTNQDQPLCIQAFPSPNILPGDVQNLAQQVEPDSYTFTQEHGGEIIPLDDNKSYAVWWQPEGFDPTTDTVIVSLGGHGGYAVKDFAVWYPELIQRDHV